MSVLESNLEKIKDKIKDCKLLTHSILGIEIPSGPSTDEYKLYDLNSSLGESTFSGSGYIIDTGIPQLELVSGYTIIVRIYPENWTNYRGVIGSFYSDGSYTKGGLWGLQCLNNSLEYCHYNSGTYTKINISTSYVPLNKWTILCLTYDGNTQGRIYCGYDLITESSSFNVLIPVNNVQLGRALGNKNITDTRYFKGKMSHCNIYNKCFTLEEISEAINSIKESVGE